MGFFSRHRKAFKSVIASFGMLFGLLTGVSLLTEVADAASAPDNQICNGLSISYDEDAYGGWTCGFNGSVNGKVSTSGIWGFYSTHSAGISLANISNSQATISFSYSFSQGSTKKPGSYSFSVGTAVSPYSYLLNSGQSLDISLKSGGNARNESTSTLSLSNLILTSGSSDVTFVPAEKGGSFSVDGKIVNASTTKNNKNFTYNLTAYPAEGFRFRYWTFDDAPIGGSQTAYTFRNGLEGMVSAVFAPIEKTAQFRANGSIYSDLNLAITAARNASDKTITAVSDGVVKAGTYSIPQGVTLFVPNKKDLFDTSSYLNASPACSRQRYAPTCYIEIEFENGTNVVFQSGSNAVIASDMFVQSNTHTGQPNGPYGHVLLNVNSKFTFEGGSNLYCWGFISGDGQIIAKSGSSVYEMFQMSSWRGGNATLEVAVTKKGNKVFPVTQYYIQNIESSVVFESGSREYLSAGIVMSDEVQTMSFLFIGASADKKGMFVLEKGTILKKYDKSTDRLLLQVEGDGYFSSLSLSFTFFGIGYTLNSQDFYLPITNNIDLKMLSGTATEGQDLCFLPGSTFEISENATLTISNKKSVYLYDTRDWAGQNYNFGDGTVTYMSDMKSNGKVFNRNAVQLKGASINVNGTINVESGSGLYSTNGEKNKEDQYNVVGSNAVLYSSKRTGTVIYPANMNTSVVTKQYVQNNNVGFVDINAAPAKLINGNLTFATNTPGNTFKYDKVLDCWSAPPVSKTGLFKTLDDNSIQTILLHDDVKQSNYTGLFYYSKETSASYNAADERYYYLNKGVVSKRNEWWKDTTSGAYYHFGPNQYAYQNVSVVLSPTASGDNPARGIEARYFFGADAKLLRMVSVTSITSNFSSDVTITNGICYYNGIKAGFGLFENQSHVYLAKDDGSLMKDGTYYVPSHKINNIKDSSGKVLTAGLYYFDENGHMYDSNFKVITRGNAS